MPSVVPLSIDALPAITSARWRSTRLPWSWVGRLDRPFVLGLTGTGVVRLRWDGFESGELTSREELSLSDGEGRRGRVLVDRWLALNVVAATLGFGAPKTLRRLGSGEKGILAGHLAALLTFTGGRVVVELAAPAATRTRPRDITRAAPAAVGLSFHAEAAGAAGPLRVEVPAVWLTAASWPAPATAAIGKVAARLETTARIALAETTLAGAAVAGAGRGDIVVFDGAAFSRAVAPDARVRVRIGTHDAECELRADGAIVFLGPFRPAHRDQGSSSGDAGDGGSHGGVVEVPTTMSSGSDDPKLDVLAGAPVEIVAEIGRVTLRGDELLGLERGSVLAFGHRAGAPVDLVVGGRTWARGELVNVDGELGVRITEMVRA
jgi:type III secretion system YscQ/HrcQ family protein